MAPAWRWHFAGEMRHAKLLHPQVRQLDPLHPLIATSTTLLRCPQEQERAGWKHL